MVSAPTIRHGRVMMLADVAQEGEYPDLEAAITALLDHADALGMGEVALHLNAALVVLDGTGKMPPGA